jgi:2-succinyl-6-hydroxy-2,4-cyclohexadiene-1-carboxylate synthase
MFIEVNENQYWVERSGQGEPLILLHGFTGSTQTWKENIEDWAKHFEVVAIDLPGHGKTEVDKSFTMESFCIDLSLLIHKLNFQSVHLLGYSMGGRTALSFACSYPSFIKSLILESASPGLKTVEERKARIQQDERLCYLIERNGLESFVEYWENIPLFQSQRTLPQKIQSKIRQERLIQKETGLIMSLRWMGTGAQASRWDDLEIINFPVLLIVGELDEKFIQINQQMLKQLPNAKINVISNVGHAPHVEDSRNFGKIVSAFILHGGN